VVALRKHVSNAHSRHSWSIIQQQGISFFGTALPSWAVPNHDTAEKFFGLHSLHSLVAWVLVALIALQVLGGLKHLLIDKGRVFQRMWL
jgi:cytochrome b561